MDCYHVTIRVLNIIVGADHTVSQHLKSGNIRTTVNYRLTNTMFGFSESCQVRPHILTEFNPIETPLEHTRLICL